MPAAPIPFSIIHSECLFNLICQKYQKPRSLGQIHEVRNRNIVDIHCLAWYTVLWVHCYFQNAPMTMQQENVNMDLGAWQGLHASSMATRVSGLQSNWACLGWTWMTHSSSLSSAYDSEPMCEIVRIEHPSRHLPAPCGVCATLVKAVVRETVAHPYIRYMI